MNSAGRFVGDGGDEDDASMTLLRQAEAEFNEYQ